MSDVRMFPRFRVVLAVELRADDGTRNKAHTLNISREGAYLLTTEPAPLGARLRLHVRDGEAVATIEGLVVRVPEPDIHEPRGMAVFLTSTDAEWGHFCDRAAASRDPADKTRSRGHEA